MAAVTCAGEPEEIARALRATADEIKNVSGWFGSLTSPLRFIVSARIPEGVPSHLSALSRSELLVRLNALADDTRLRILELLARQGEMSTPDVRAQLELSQSAVSRHLEHLTATGYLIGEREQGTNLYRLNPDRIDHTFKALKEFCRLV